MLDDDLVIENVSKHFASFVALQSIHLRIERGQFVLFSGRKWGWQEHVIAFSGRHQPSQQRTGVDRRKRYTARRCGPLGHWFPIASYAAL